MNADNNSTVHSNDNLLTLSNFIPKDLQKNNNIKQGISFKEIINKSNDSLSHHQLKQNNEILKNDRFVSQLKESDETIITLQLERVASSDEGIIISDSINQDKKILNSIIQSTPEETLGNGLKGYWKKRRRRKKIFKKNTCT